MSDGEHGHDTKLWAAVSTDPTNFTAIGNVSSITGPTQTRDAIEKSTMDSTSKFREFIPGMLDAGETTFEVNYDGSASGNAAFLGGTNATTGLLKSNNTALSYFVVYNDGAATATTAASHYTNHSHWYAKGLMTSLGHAIPFDDKITQSVTIKFTGVATYIDIPA